MKKFDGGPFYPTVEHMIDGAEYTHEGISMREWYAGMALQGLLCNESFTMGEHTEGCLAVKAFKLADRMLEVRDKK
jgi:hypothetical protein